MRNTVGNVEDSDSFDENEFNYTDEDERREVLKNAGMELDEYEDY